MPGVEENPSFSKQLKALTWTGDPAQQRADKLSLASIFKYGAQEDEDKSSRTDRLFQVIVWLAKEELVQALIDSPFLTYFYANCYAIGLCERLLERLQAASGLSNDSVAVSAASDETGLSVVKQTPLATFVQAMEAFNQAVTNNPAEAWPVLSNSVYHLSIDTFRANLDFFLKHASLDELIPVLAGDLQAMTALLVDIQRQPLTLGWIDLLKIVLSQEDSSPGILEWLKSFGASCNAKTLDQHPLALCVLPYKGGMASDRRDLLVGRNLDTLLSKTMRSLLSLPSKKLVVRLLCHICKMFALLSSLEDQEDKKLISANLLALCREAIVSNLLDFYLQGRELNHDPAEDNDLIELLHKCQLLEAFTAKLKKYAEEIFQNNDEEELSLGLLYDRWIGQTYIRRASFDLLYPELRYQNDYPWTQHELFARELIRVFDLPRGPVDVFELYVQRIGAYWAEIGQDVDQLPRLFETVLLIAFTLSTDPAFQQAILAKMQPASEVVRTTPWYEDIDRSDGVSVVDRLVRRNNKSALELLLTKHKLSEDLFPDILGVAAFYKQWEIVSVLLDPTYRTECHISYHIVTQMLLSAAHAGQLNIVKVLLQLKGFNQPNSTMVGQALDAAASAGQWDVVHLLGSLTGENQASSFQIGNVLVAASRAGQWDVVRLLGSVTGKNQPDGMAVDSALTAVSRSGQVELVKRLMCLSVNSLAVERALVAATSAGQWDVIHLLVERALKLSNPTDSSGVGPALVAAGRAGQVDVVDELMRLSVKSSAVGYALCESAHAKQWGVVARLVKRAGASNQPDAQAVSRVFFAAVQAGQLDIVSALMSLQGANQLNTEAITEAFSYAVTQQQWKMIHHLLMGKRGSMTEPRLLYEVIKSAILSMIDQKGVVVTRQTSAGLFKSVGGDDPLLCIQAALCEGTKLGTKEITIIISRSNATDNCAMIQIIPTSETNVARISKFLSECGVSTQSERTDNGHIRLVVQGEYPGARLEV